MNRMACNTINRRAYDTGKHRQMQEPQRRKIFVLKRFFFFFLCAVSAQFLCFLLTEPERLGQPGGSQQGIDSLGCIATAHDVIVMLL